MSESLEVHHLTTYATDVAKAFSAFYRDCPVLTDDAEQTASRLALVTATRTVLASTLDLMGIRAPETM
jgi:arginyl-tRNA synthetase